MGPYVSMISHNENILIVRVGGYKTFFSRAEQTYIPTQYYKMRVGAEIVGYILPTVEAVIITAIVPGRSKKALRDWLA